MGCDRHLQHTGARTRGGCEWPTKQHKIKDRKDTTLNTMWTALTSLEIHFGQVFTSSASPRLGVSFLSLFWYLSVIRAYLWPPWGWGRCCTFSQALFGFVLVSVLGFWSGFFCLNVGGCALFLELIVFGLVLSWIVLRGVGRPCKFLCPLVSADLRHSSRSSLPSQCSLVTSSRLSPHRRVVLQEDAGSPSSGARRFLLLTTVTAWYT